jgi:hypothetical protein
VFGAAGTSTAAAEPCAATARTPRPSLPQPPRSSPSPAAPDCRQSRPVVGGITVAVVLGVAGGILAVAALVAVVFVVGTRRRRGCAPRREDDHVTVELLYFDDAPTTTRFCRTCANCSPRLASTRRSSCAGSRRSRMRSASASSAPDRPRRGPRCRPERDHARGLRDEVPAVRDGGGVARHPAGRLDPVRAGGRMIAVRAGRHRSAERAKPT